MDFFYKVRWLNGPLAGRELDLPTGDTRLGGEDPDIALPLEEGVSTVLTVTEEGVTLSPPVPVWVDGAVWDCTQTLPLEKVIDLAGQMLLLGKPETQLTSPPLPTRYVAKSETKKVFSWPMWAALGLLLLAGSVIGGGVLFHSEKSPEPFDAAHWLKQTVKDLELNGLEAEIDAHGTVRLSGLVESSQSLKDLHRQLQQRGFNFHDDSMGADTLRQRVRQLLILNGYQGAEVTSGKTPGSVEIHGAIKSDAAWQRTTMRLHEIKLLKKWVVVNDQAELFQRLVDALHNNALMEGLSISKVGKEFMVSGEKDAKSIAKITQIINDFNSQDKVSLKAHYQNIPTAVQAEHILPSAIISVGGNKKSVYLQLANSMRLQQGAVLPSGFKIYSITHRTVTFIREQQVISVPLNF